MRLSIFLLSVFALFASAEIETAVEPAKPAYVGFVRTVTPKEGSLNGARYAHEILGDASRVPREFDWGRLGALGKFTGLNLLTRMRNQHIPRYCGSCWAQASVSALSDRVFINRPFGRVPTVYSVQAIMNCSGMGCGGGDAYQTYSWLVKSGFALPSETCMSYEACSTGDSVEECSAFDFTCKAVNVCRTCTTTKGTPETNCSEINNYPNATLSDVIYHSEGITVDAIKAEVFLHGPVASVVDASNIVDYEGGVYSNVEGPRNINHAVSIVGWGVDKATGVEFWRIRNSWGEYWGENGFFRVKTGSNIAGVETEFAGPLVKSVTDLNYPCHEDGGNCNSSSMEEFYNGYTGPVTIRGFPPHLAQFYPERETDVEEE